MPMEPIPSTTSSQTNISTMLRMACSTRITIAPPVSPSWKTSPGRRCWARRAGRALGRGDGEARRQSRRLRPEPPNDRVGPTASPSGEFPHPRWPIRSTGSTINQSTSRFSLWRWSTSTRGLARCVNFGAFFAPTVRSCYRASIPPATGFDTAETLRGPCHRRPWSRGWQVRSG